MSKETITILGANGMLGSDLQQTLLSSGFDIKCYDLPDFDITDTSQLEDSMQGSDFVINCAAYTNVDKAESDVIIANEVNGYSVGKLGGIAKKLKIPVIHISTDFVFDGKKESPYTELDKPAPLSIYGSSKLLGENLLLDSDADACIIRVEWTYGKNGANFITKIQDFARTRDQIKVVNDQIGSPTHTLEVSRALRDILLLKKFPTGIYHFAAKGYTSRFEMAKYLFEKLGIEVKIFPCSSDEFPAPAKRPLNSKFDCSKIEKLLGRKLPTWQEMLDEYIRLA